jgi:hypothetical protein
MTGHGRTRDPLRRVPRGSTRIVLNIRSVKICRIRVLPWPDCFQSLAAINLFAICRRLRDTGSFIEPESIIHEALATITYDDQAKRYRFVTHTEKGMFAIPEAKLIEGGWQWGLQFPQDGGFRYTVKMTDKGEWHEIGERSQDGKTWTQFHEMTLKRVR